MRELHPFANAEMDASYPANCEIVDFLHPLLSRLTLLTLSFTVAAFGSSSNPLATTEGRLHCLPLIPPGNPAVVGAGVDCDGMAHHSGCH